jgi:uncharacterized protein YjbJ (UPF0337 family)
MAAWMPLARCPEPQSIRHGGADVTGRRNGRQAVRKRNRRARQALFPRWPPGRWNKEYSAMNWDRIEGNWKQFKGKAKEQWGKLTDDDLDVVDGKRQQLEGRLQERYGYAKDKATEEIDGWLSRQ